MFYESRRQVSLCGESRRVSRSVPQPRPSRVEMQDLAECVERAHEHLLDVERVAQAVSERVHQGKIARVAHITEPSTNSTSQGRCCRVESTSARAGRVPAQN